jgi:hypothetical protein
LALAKLLAVKVNINPNQIKQSCRYQLFNHILNDKNGQLKLISTIQLPLSSFKNTSSHILCSSSVYSLSC